MTKNKRAVQAAKELAVLRFYPQMPEAVGKIAEIVNSMCSSVEQIGWLVDTMIREHDEWPGPMALRETFARRYPPADSS